MIFLPAKENLIGQRFNHLVVLEEVPKEQRKNSKKVEWKCLCDCGNTTNVITNYLKSGHTKSCGCRRVEVAKENFTKDLTNKVFNNLTALEPTERRGADGSIIWKCLCKCGNIHYASTNSLINSAITSCGCVRSKGEAKINSILFENNVNYQTQYWFKDLKDKKYLYFDFAILNEDQSIKCLVEYQGIQHYHPEVIHGTWTNIPQEHDLMKKEYCKKNNILLIEIPYTDFDKINWEYLKNKLSL